MSFYSLPVAREERRFFEPCLISSYISDRFCFFTQIKPPIYWHKSGVDFVHFSVLKNANNIIIQAWFDDGNTPKVKQSYSL